MWVMAAVNVAGPLITLALGEETRGRPLADTAGVPAHRPSTRPVLTAPEGAQP